MKVLITGGAGYIGSTTAKALEQAGHRVVILDNLSSGPRVFTTGRTLYEGDVADRALLDRIHAEHADLGAIIHMAARIVVPESVSQPALYYRENVAKSLELFDWADAAGIGAVVFSSSASVYAPPIHGTEVTEDSPLAPASPYARTKMQMEQILTDIAAAGGPRAVILRYFNPIGSDPDLATGVYARTPSHVLGQLTLAATGQIPAFTITGTDFPTRDGTGLRDYLHVWDLARAHVAAIERFDAALGGRPSRIVNVGTGRGTTVRELVAAFESVSGMTIPVTLAPRRAGDVAGAYAGVQRAAADLGWRAELSLEDGLRSALAWMRRRQQILGYR